MLLSTTTDNHTNTAVCGENTWYTFNVDPVRVTCRTIRFYFKFGRMQYTELTSVSLMKSPAEVELARPLGSADDVGV